MVLPDPEKPTGLPKTKNPKQQLPHDPKSGIQKGVGGLPGGAELDKYPKWIRQIMNE